MVVPASGAKRMFCISSDAHCGGDVGLAGDSLPQKKRTGLHLPMNPDLNWLKTASTDNRIRQNLSTAAGSYERCSRSSRNPATAWASA